MASDFGKKLINELKKTTHDKEMIKQSMGRRGGVQGLVSNVQHMEVIRSSQMLSKLKSTIALLEANPFEKSHAH